MTTPVPPASALDARALPYWLDGQLPPQLDGAVIVSKDSDFLERVQRLGSPPKLVYVTSGNRTTRHLKDVFLVTFLEAQRLLIAGEDLVEIGG